MGVDVSAEVMIGIWFEDEERAKDFILENFDLSEYDEEDLDKMCTGELSECLDIKYGLLFKDYSGYNNYGGCMGIEVGESDLDPSHTDLYRIWSKLYDLIPKECHKDIKAHIWARYY